MNEVTITISDADYSPAIERLFVNNGWTKVGSSFNCTNNKQDLYLAPPERLLKIPQPEAMAVNLPDFANSD